MRPTTLASLLLLCLTTAALAQQPAPPPAPAATGKPAASPDAKEKPEPKKEEPKKPKTIDETVKDFERLEGMVTLYRKVEEGKQKLYAELTESHLNQLFVLQSTFSTGNAGRATAGSPVRDLLLKLVKTPDERILLVTPNLWYRAKHDSPIATAVSRDFPEGYVEVFPIVARQAERESYLVDLVPALKGGLGVVTQRFEDGYNLDSDKTFFSAIKDFPQNVIFELTYHFKLQPKAGGSNTGADPRSLPVKVVYNLFGLPEDGYRPRLADPRVGYFVNGMISAGRAGFDSFDDEAARDCRVMYINRWRLEKADPTAAVSPPKRPIVFWLDKAIPLEHRDAAREGILMWNKAFEAAGFKDALVVKQMPDDADWDHADMRYNTLRWVTSPPNPDGAYAIALLRENPLTGEIINASINVDSNYARVAHSQLRDTAEPSLPEGSGCLVDDGREMMRQGWLGWLALQALDVPRSSGPRTATAVPAPRLDEKTFVKDMLRALVCHEMGHILGLRHNFVASAFLDERQLTDPAVVAQYGVSSSVMDYISVNILAVRKPGADLFSKTVGPYDIWAIQYGYTPLDAKTPEEELPALREIASQCNQPGHEYETDDRADGYDPYVVRHDLGKDPLAVQEEWLKLYPILIANLGNRLPEPGQDYSQFTKELFQLIGSYGRVSSYVTRFVGGMKTHRNNRGDRDEQPTFAPLPGAVQRRALRLITSYLLAENAIQVPQEYLTRLAGDPFGSDGRVSRAFPLFSDITNIQQSALRALLASDRLERIVNTEFRSTPGEDVFTLLELFTTLRGAIWPTPDAKSGISALRRELQRAWLGEMTRMFSGEKAVPADARMLAWSELRVLRSRLPLWLRDASDQYTRIHLQDCLTRIAKALDAQQTMPVGR